MKTAIIYASSHETTEKVAQQTQNDLGADNAFPELLRKHAITSKCVGGEFLFEKTNFTEKPIVKKVSGISLNVSKIDEGKVVSR